MGADGGLVRGPPGGGARTGDRVPGQCGREELRGVGGGREGGGEDRRQRRFAKAVFIALKLILDLCSFVYV